MTNNLYRWYITYISIEEWFNKNYGWIKKTESTIDLTHKLESINTLSFLDILQGNNNKLGLKVINNLSFLDILQEITTNLDWKFLTDQQIKMTVYIFNHMTTPK